MRRCFGLFPRHVSRVGFGRGGQIDDRLSQAQLALRLAVGLGLLAAWCVLWTLVALDHAARVAPMPYFPVLNVLDFAHVAALLAIGLWLSIRAEAGESRSRVGEIALGGLAFLVLNAVILRAVHHWAGVRYTLDAMMHSVLAQAANVHRQRMEAKIRSIRHGLLGQHYGTVRLATRAAPCVDGAQKPAIPNQQ